MARMILLLLVLTFSVGSAQLKYAERDTQIVVVGLGYSNANKIALGGLQIGISPDGRADFGVAGAVSFGNTFTKALGLYADLAIAKPIRREGAGINMLLAAARNWQRVRILYGERDITLRATAGSIGFELYFQPKKSVAIPFAQIVKTFSRLELPDANIQSSVLSFSVGTDFVLSAKNRPWWVLTPGITFIGHAQPAYSFDLAFILGNNPRSKRTDSPSTGTKE